MNHFLSFNIDKQGWNDDVRRNDILVYQKLHFAIPLGL